MRQAEPAPQLLLPCTCKTGACQGAQRSAGAGGQDARTRKRGRAIQGRQEWGRGKAKEASSGEEDEGLFKAKSDECGRHWPMRRRRQLRKQDKDDEITRSAYCRRYKTWRGSKEVTSVAFFFFLFYFLFFGFRGVAVESESASRGRRARCPQSQQAPTGLSYALDRQSETATRWRRWGGSVKGERTIQKNRLDCTRLRVHVSMQCLFSAS